MELSNNPEQLLNNWKDKCANKRLLHIKSSQYYFNLHMFIGISIIIFSAISSIIGSSIYYLEDKYGIIILLTVSMINILITIFASIQHFLGFKEKQLKHLSISNNYSNLSREIEETEAFGDYSHNTIHDIHLKFNSINENSPNIPEWIIDKYTTNDNSNIELTSPFHEN